MPIAKKPVIQRYLSEAHLESAVKDMKPVINLLNKSYGELSLQLREDYFNIYYQGNSLAKVQFNAGGTYSASIHSKFIDGILDDLNPYSEIKYPPEAETSNKYINFRVQPKNLHGFFQSANLKRLSSNIRRVNNGEEITMEQVIVTDNPPIRDFIIIDRQVADHEDFARVDLLALKRDANDKYHFVAIELKLGRNPELKEKAGAQVSGYVDHIREHMNDYSTCYEENYRQKKRLGLFEDGLPNSIEINRNLPSVKGIVVSSGYSQIGNENLKSLRNAIKENGWHISAYQMPPLKLEGIVE